MAVVYFEGLDPAPWELIPHSCLMMATQRELEQAWAHLPTAAWHTQDLLDSMGRPLKVPTRRLVPGGDAMGPLVYFIQGDAGPIKIGFTARTLASRLRNLQTASSAELRVLGWQRGGPELEQELQARFEGHRLRGEWFRPDPELLAYIEALASFRRGPADN